MLLFLTKMKVFFARIYSVYAGIVFLLTWVIYLLPQLILAQKTSWHLYALRINYYWAWTFMFLIRMPVKIVWTVPIDRKKQYVLCANHFSFFDIPVNYLLGISFKYIGKSSISRVPIFGYMFKKIHIMVNRESVRSRAESMRHAREAMDQGFNMCFFPEGGIKSTHPPQMVPFRDGAFRLAAEHRHPVLPVALHTNHLIMPDDGRYLLFRQTIRITIGAPIEPMGISDEEIKNLKQATYQAIQNLLKG